MPQLLRLSRTAGLTGLIVATALIAAACGSSTTNVAGEADPRAGASPAGESPAGESVPPAAEPEEAEPGEAEPEETGAEATTEDAPVTNQFPDVDVVDIADASTLNIATELGGGDLPVLLWFWAPH